MKAVSYPMMFREQDAAAARRTPDAVLLQQGGDNRADAVRSVFPMGKKMSIVSYQNLNDRMLLQIV